MVDLKAVFGATTRLQEHILSAGSSLGMLREDNIYSFIDWMHLESRVLTSLHLKGRNLTRS